MLLKFVLPMITATLGLDGMLAYYETPVLNRSPIIHYLNTLFELGVVGTFATVTVSTILIWIDSQYAQELTSLWFLSSVTFATIVIVIRVFFWKELTKH